MHPHFINCAECLLQYHLQKTKAIVTPLWLQDSVKSGRPVPYRSYIAVHHLEDETSRSHDTVQDASSGRSSDIPSEAEKQTEPAELVDVTEVELLSHTAKYSCLRPSPLVCPNQSLVKEIDVIRQGRNVEGEERSMLSYSRAISVIKAYPHVITEHNIQDIHELPFLGVKILSMIEEFTETGQITEAQRMLADPRFQSLSAFITIHGIGPHTARRLYDLGLRTLEELERYYEVKPGVSDEETMPLFDAEASANTEAAGEQSIKIGLALRHDLGQTIPREEVEEINGTIMRELSHIQRGCKSVIAGGYRRGKPQSNDVDIVITHTDWNLGSQKVKGLCRKLVQRLHEQGLVTHVMHLSGFHEHNVLRTHHWDSLEKALTVFVSRHDPSQQSVYRRVDLIFAAPEVFWTAVVGWTGSTMFERDLRLWAKQQKGMKFDSSGISRRHDSKLYHPRTERDVFKVLGLVYIHPTLRNADA
ncbi:Nucleotidyltransferase [Suillus hirtellus]|nr:Nucleotidyltransferase [Suillus hirtellus]